MADYQGSVPVQTVRDNELKQILVDGQSGTTATKKLTVAQEGDAIVPGTNDFGIPVLVKDDAGNHAIPELGAQGGLKTQLLDVAGNEASFVADGDAVSSQKGLALLGSDGTNFQLLATDASGRPQVELATAQGVDGASAPAKTVQVGGKDSSGNLQTLATDSSGKLRVVAEAAAGITTVCEFATTATVGAGTVTTHDFAVAAGTFKGEQVLVGARGAVKVRVGSYNGTTFTPKYTYFQQPGFNGPVPLKCLEVAGGGSVAVRVEITNLDGQSSDVYSTLEGTVV